MGSCRDIDPLVTPYLDGEATAAERSAVDTHLAVCPPCRLRAAAEAAARQVLRARKGEGLCSKTPVGLQTQCLTLSRTGAPSRIGSRLVPLSMAAALAIVVGGVFVYGLTARSPTVLAAQLAVDHLKCFALFGSAAPTAVKTAESRVRAQYGWQPPTADDSDPGELRLVGARRCLYGEGMLAHLLYRSQGRPISLFMLPETVHLPSIVGALGYEALTWSGQGKTFVLLGHEPRVELERIAARLREGPREP